MEERYETLKELGSGNFGVARLAKHKNTGELVAIKYIKRGKKRIMSAQYSIPDYVRVCEECRHLLSRIFVANPAMAERPTWLPDGYFIVAEHPTELPTDWAMIVKMSDPRNKVKEYELKKRGWPSMQKLCDVLSHQGSNVCCLGNSTTGRHEWLRGEIQASNDHIRWLGEKVSELELELKRQNDEA